MKKKIISLFVALCIAINILPMAVWGAGEEDSGEAILSGTSGESAVVLNKTIIPATNDSPAKIRLEAYVNGSVTTTEQMRPADIVLLLDQSTSMMYRVGSSTKLELLKTAAQSFVDEVAKMNNATGDLYRVAIVGFGSENSNTEILSINNGSGKALNNLTGQDYQNSLVNCNSSAVASNGILSKAISQLTSNGATRADLGLEIATDIFANQPNGTYDDREKIVVLITDGEPTSYMNFDATVANNAVEEARSLKADGAHVFSLYIGTPSTNSQSFLQAVSSNYPNATAYNELGNKVDSTYYSAHSDGADIENMLTTVANTISALSTLNETSIITGTISDHFMLAADVETTALDQIEIYTVDKTANGWSDVEVPYEYATVSFIGDGNKTIGVSGFNFAANCITDEARNGSFYGRKIVIYIPIVEDESSDIFGGWVPASINASIYQNSEALENGDATATAGTLNADAVLSYSVVAAERAFHVDGTLLTDDAFFTVSFTGADGIAASVFDEMIPEIPDYLRNIGVDITYKLIDIGTTDIDTNDRNDDVVVATLSVNAADGIDVTDPSVWTWVEEHESTTLTINANEFFAEKVYVIVATLTSIRDVNSPDTLSVYNYLDVSAVRGDLAHIVYGVIDANGKLTVPTTAPGSLIGNTYTEAVTENHDSAVMTFSVNEGYRIKEILILTSTNAPFDTRSIVYSTVSGANVVPFDLDGDGEADELIIADDGSWSFGAKAVVSGIAVEVTTEPITKTLTTSADKGSEIVVGRTYNYSATETFSVPFRALNGYAIATVEVNGVVYDLSSESDLQTLIDTYSAEFTYADGTSYVIGGDVILSASRDNDVKITSLPRKYAVNVKYHIENEDGSITELTEMSKAPVYVEFGALILESITLDHVEGDVTVIDGAKYVLNGWYLGHVGNGFSDIIADDATMSASDLTLNAVWVKIPTYTVKSEIDENGSISVTAGSAAGNVFTETVTENEDSSVVTFTANEGYKIEEIYITVGQNVSLVYSTDEEATVVNVDLDGDGNGDEITLANDGSWSFTAKNVESDISVRVSTVPEKYTLTLNYVIKNAYGTYEVIYTTDGESVSYDRPLNEVITIEIERGVEVTLDGIAFIFDGAYRGYEGDGYSVLIDGTETMPASNISINLVFTPIPEDVIAPDTSDGIGSSAIILIAISGVVGAMIIGKKRRIADGE